MSPVNRSDHPGFQAADDLLADFLRSGEESSLARLFNLTGGALVRQATQWIGCADTAEDLVQEAFLLLLDRPQRFEPGRAAMPYLRGIVRHRASARRRELARRGAEQMDGLEKPDPRQRDAATRAAQREAERLIVAAVSDLHEPYRSVVEMYLESCTPPRDIARHLGIAPGTARVRLHRGLQLLRARLPKQLQKMLVLVLAGMLVRQAPAQTVRGWKSLGTCRHRKWFAGGVLVLLLAGGGLSMGFAPAPRAGDSETPVPPTVSRSQAIIPRSVGAVRNSLPTRNPLADLRRGLFCHWEVGGSAAVGVHARFTPLGLGRRDHGRWLRSDASGWIDLHGLSDGDYLLQLARGRTAVLRGLKPAEASLQIAVPRGFPVDVEVTDAVARPCAGAQLWLATPHSMADGGLSIGRCDEAGLGRLYVPCGGCLVAAVAPDGRRSRYRWIAGPGRIRLKLAAAYRPLRGRVVDPEGRGLPGASIRAGLSSSKRQPLLFPAEALISDAQGRFCYPRLPELPHLVGARFPGRRPGLHRVGLGSPKGSECVLELSEGRCQKLALRTAAGRAPVTQALVRQVAHHLFLADSYVPDHRGQICLGGLSSSVRLRIEARGFESLDLGLQPDRTACEVLLQPLLSRGSEAPGVGCSYRFQLIGGGDPGPVGGRLIAQPLRDSESPKVISLLGAHGEFRAPPGRYWLDVRGPRILPFRCAIDLGPAATRDLHFDLQPGRRRELRIPVPGEAGPEAIEIKIRTLGADWRTLGRSRRGPKKRLLVRTSTGSGWHELLLIQGSQRWRAQFFIQTSAEWLRVQVF